mgnify:FL=1|jgi:DNA-directed RNA polymerase subunit RPC12/RpoP
MSQEQHLKSACAHCHGRISFPASARGMTVTCPHCGQQTVLNAAAEAPAPAAQPTPVAKPTPVAQAKPAAAKPLTEAQKAAMAAARAANPIARPPGPRPSAKPADKKSVVVKAQWADSAEEPADGKPLRCDFCGTKIPTGATACPDCGTKVAAKPQGPTKPNWFRRIGLALIAVLTVVAAVRWGQLYLSNRPATGKDGKPVKSGVEVLNHSLQPQPGTSLLYIRGNVTNHSDVPYFSVKVEVELLDKAGASLGKASDTRMVLDAHKLFPFNVAVLDPDAKSYTNLTVSAQR